MKTNVLQYNVIIRKEGYKFVSYVPTLGISDFGKTIDQAKKHTYLAIKTHIEGLLKTHSGIPAPDSEDFYISQAQVKFNKSIKFAY